jgi:hypothetical protein
MVGVSYSDPSENHDSEERARQSPDCSSQALGIVLSAEICR